ncbi:phosphate starvation-inducible protein PhoH [Pseudarcicella hirudinis]|uniref:PhoH-like protein n=1 Tax=Pseudarcicella hirudinis TaxID=1079859 RepID=A0A1I5N0N5_9BACT|nr:PhoH family protein [Pseudarcicella hirudinis]SFP15354.1 phosphate starvation-inducible protein PhoH [Pseudarcicella hirudinis]
MTENVITLEDVSLIDLLGVENGNIKIVSAAFPQSKIISRGNEIIIKGSQPEIVRINDILNAIIEHVHKYGKISKEQVKTYLQMDKNPEEDPEAHLKEEDDVLLYGTKGVVIRVKTPNQKKLVEAAKENDIVFAVGPAGTGKTYTAVAIAVKALKNKEVKKIIITRPAVEAGENLGFLPGDLKEKIDPYLRPIYDALDDMIQPEKLKFFIDNRVIEIAPLAYMRGRTLNNAFILLDEAQNTTPMQMKMFLTRMGVNSKTIITGDKSQVDLPLKQKSGLAEATRILEGIKGIGFVELDGKDVVRHRLVRDIIMAYEKSEAEREQNNTR